MVLLNHLYVFHIFMINTLPFLIQLGLDNTLQFTMELVGHVDGAMAELVRSKLLYFFKDKAWVAVSCGSKNTTGFSSHSLLGGDV